MIQSRNDKTCQTGEKMTIVTFAGLIGIEKEEEEWKVTGEKAEYLFSPSLVHALSLEKEPYRYENMLPLLLETFPGSRVVTVGTPRSIEGQSVLLKTRYPRIADKVEYHPIEDAHDYHVIFRQLGDVLESDDDLIVDITHSFRHLPALMMVDMIIANIKHPGRVRHILFAKELETGQRYRIVDLREYLTLANVSYALASFTKNYTIATIVKTVDEVYQALLNDLSRFGEHMLANSFEALLTSENDNPPVAQNILDVIGVVKTHERFKEIIHPIELYLDEITEHMRQVLAQAENPMDERLHFFARLMFDKGYLLNALTLLDEAAAAYCVEAFRKLPSTAHAVERFEAAIQNRDNLKLYNRYELTNIAKNIVKLGKFYKKNLYRNDDATIMERFIEEARDYVNGHYRQLKSLRDFLFACDDTRNNLAHANSAERLDDARNEIQSLFIRYEEVCYEEDPLKRFKH
jgi:CRISPR-associated DxTHG motif protein